MLGLSSRSLDLSQFIKDRHQSVISSLLGGAFDFEPSSSSFTDKQAATSKLNIHHEVNPVSSYDRPSIEEIQFVSAEPPKKLMILSTSPRVLSLPFAILSDPW